MANSLLTIQDVTRETLAVLHEESQLLKACTRKYEDRFAKTGAKIGASVDVRKPAKYGVSNQADITGEIQTSDESAATLTMNKRRVVGMDFTSEDLTLKIDEFSKRFIRPAAKRLAREVDLEIAQEILVNGFRLQRTLLTDSVEFSDVTKANAQLSTQLA